MLSVILTDNIKKIDKVISWHLLTAEICVSEVNLEPVVNETEVILTSPPPPPHRVTVVIDETSVKEVTLSRINTHEL